MKIFLSYPSPDKNTAESIAFSLRSRGYQVFLDRDDLPPGRSYDEQIERAIDKSSIFIFLISPDSFTEGRYALSELKFARQKWNVPDGHVLPVMVRKTPLQDIPSYLKAITILEPSGSIAAETSAAVEAMAKSIGWRPRYVLSFAAIFLIVLVGGYFLMIHLNPGPPKPTPGPNTSSSPPGAGGSPDDLGKQIAGRRDEALRVNQVIQDSYKDVVEAGNAGVIKLLADPKPLEDLGLRGGGTYYSFLRRTHEYGYGSDIELQHGSLKVGFAGWDFGYFLDLGSRPIRPVIDTATEQPPSWLESGRKDAWSFLWTYRPPDVEQEVRSAQSEASRGRRIGG